MVFPIFSNNQYKTDFGPYKKYFGGHSENQRKKSSRFIGSNQFFAYSFEKINFSIYLIIFKLRDRFWTLWDGPLDPLDRYKHPKKKIDKKHIF